MIAVLTKQMPSAPLLMMMKMEKVWRRRKRVRLRMVMVRRDLCPTGEPVVVAGHDDGDHGPADGGHGVHLGRGTLHPPRLPAH